MKYLIIENKCWFRNFKNLRTEIFIKRRAVQVFFLLITLTFMGMGISIAEDRISIGPKNAKIGGSIPYSVIGKYQAQFKDFKGTIKLDEELRTVQSVFLQIEVKSIASNCPWCDKIVRSGRLLNTKKFPEIIFQSSRIIHDGQGFKVKGILEMHGIQRVMTLPFGVEMIDQKPMRMRILKLQGTWMINRKNFNIVWNKLLDRGGVLVGDYLTVNWQITQRIR